MGTGIFVCRMVPKISKKGNHYFAGYCGPLNFALLKNAEMSGDGESVWDLFVDGKSTSPAFVKVRKPQLGHENANKTEEKSEDDEAPF